MRGIAWAAWLRKEAPLLRGRSSSEGDDEGLAERTRRIARDDAAMPRIEGYDLQGEIGRGGSATVYLARELKHDRLVALKVLHPALAASLQAERFLREISIVAKLAHPNILPLLDSGNAGDLLYYATPYVPGESLRKRIEREGKLPVAEGVRLVREAAEALDYAHRNELVHRDVKPENILLADGHALLADFGIARAMRVAQGEQLTAVGVAPGTLHYMSPEQASADGTVDGRSDQYSLACVLYELLSGAPPFTGETLEEIAIKHAVGKVPAFPPATEAVPATVKQAIHRALSKAKEDRFATAAEFSAALSGVSPAWSIPLPKEWTPGARVAAAVASLAAVALAWVVVTRVLETPAALPFSKRVLVGLGISALPLDTTLFVVVPADSVSARAGVDAGVLLRAALRRWREISVEDDARVSEVLPTDGLPSGQRLQRAAIVMGAGRFVRFRVTRDADSLTVSAAIHDTRTNGLLATREVRVASNDRLSASVVQSLADSLLFRTGVPGEHATGNPGTSSLQARVRYFQGHRALASGDFALADSSFVAATQIDEEYPQALLWLANLRSWFDASHLPWRQLPGRAAARRNDLEPQDSILLDALLALSTRDFLNACRLWSRLTTLAPNDFATWYGLGNCLRRDRTVVPAHDRPNEWRFQSSRHQSVLAYERAFRLRPAILQGFGGRSLTELQTMLFTSGGYVQTGRAADPPHLPFSGYPIWQGDTLALLALSGARIELGPGSEAFAEAIQRQRLRFRDVATLWKSEFPRNPDAIEAVAIAMEMLGDPAALDTLRRARALAVDSDDLLRIAVNEVLMRVKFSLPSDRAGLRAARDLSDSLLRAHPPERGQSPVQLGALAGLTGRASLAASYARHEGWDATLPPALARTGPAFIAFAAFGGPRDTLRALEGLLNDAILSLPASERNSARAAWLTRAAVLAFPATRLRSLPDTGETGLLPGNVISRALAADTAGVTRMLAQIAAARRWLRPADIMTDGLFPEAAALSHIGARDTATTRLDATLRAIRFTASQDLAFTYRTAPLVRAMMLRADLALAAGDQATAATWAGAVVELWSGADPFLQDAVKRMRALAR